MSRLSNKKQLKSAEYLKFLYRSQNIDTKRKEKLDLNFSVKKTPYKQESSVKYNESEVRSVLSDLKQSSQLIYFQKYQKKIQQIFENLVEKIVVLEYKIADCQRKFNSISLQLSRKTSQVVEVKRENDRLVQLNAEVQIDMKNLRQEYAKSLQKHQCQGTRQRIKQLRESIRKISGQRNDKQQNQLLSSIKEYLKQLKNSFQQNSQTKIMEIVQKVIALSFQNVEIEETLSGYVQSKIIQNIDLKIDKIILS